jgi:hypothetical protein
MKFDKYSRIARIYPAILSIIPFMILFNSFLLDVKDEYFNNILARLFLQLGLGIILLYVISQINRFIAKEIFEKRYYKNELDFPTTNMLLFNDDSLSSTYKTKIRSKIKKDYGITLPSIEMEQTDNLKTRLAIKDAVGLIRVKTKNNLLLLQHNMEYGFIRSLIGGSPLGLVLSLFLIFYFDNIHKNIFLFVVSIILVLFYLLFLLLSKYLMNRYGILYAKRLYQEYLGE